MTQTFTILIAWILQFILSCKHVDSAKLSKEQKNKTSITNYTINAEDILKDFMTWYNYTYYNIHLAQDFIGLDADSSILNRTTFLDSLATGNFVPFKTMTRDNLPIYKLYKFSNADLDIQSTVKQMAVNEILHFKMEGKELPNFDFIDLNGKTHDKSTTKGKILVLKCWFIHCIACVKEFPELNKLVDEYKDWNDILFISLAMDSKQDLISFLNNKEFKYAVIPNKEKYMSEQLRVTEYPTHILIGKNGKIVKVVNSVSDLIPFLKRETGNTSL